MSSTKINIWWLWNLDHFSLDVLLDILTHGCHYPHSKVRGANMGPIWGRQGPGGPHVGPKNLAIWELQLNSLAPGKFEWYFRYVIFQGILVIGGWASSCEIALVWTSVDFANDQSMLVQVMAWWHQATSHYLSQCWPRSMLPYGITRAQWIT